MKWSSKFNSFVAQMDPEKAVGLIRTIELEAIRRGVWIESSGRKKPIPLTTRPQVISPTARGYIHDVCWHIRTALRRVIRLVATNPQAAALMPLEKSESQWLEKYTRSDEKPKSERGPGVFCRLDALVDLESPKWQESLKFIEPNIVGIGGLSYVPAAESIVYDLFVSEFLNQYDELAFDQNTDPRELLLDELMVHARSIGIKGKPTIGLIDDKSLYELGGEFGRLLPYFIERGFNTVYADPRELEVNSEGKIFFEGTELDVLYRFLLLGELAEMEAAGENLQGIRQAFKSGKVVPTPGGDLDHKSTFEILTNPEFNYAFTEEQREAFKTHVQWTRLIFPRKTLDPHGVPVDLEKFLIRNQSRLVIKPNRSYGGKGVVIGPSVEKSQWEETLSVAFAQPKDYIVQEAASPAKEVFPVIESDGEVTLQSFYTSTGFYPGRRGLGIFGRYSQSQVVNINLGGGIAPFLIQLT